MASFRKTVGTRAVPSSIFSRAPQSKGEADRRVLGRLRKLRHGFGETFPCPAVLKPENGSEPQSYRASINSYAETAAIPCRVSTEEQTTENQRGLEESRRISLPP